MSIETNQPPLTRPLSDALIDALSSWNHITYDSRDEQ